MVDITLFKQINVLAMKAKLSILLTLVIFIFTFRFASAQISSLGIAVSTPVEDGEAKDGDIICTYSQGNSRCNQEYDSAMYGIITDNPTASIEDNDFENARLVISSDIATVNVNTLNGNIQEGDFLTSSETSGVAKKALRNGYVLGLAMEGYSSDNPQATGRIQVLINIHPTAGISGPRGNLLQFIRQGVAVPIFEPLESLRYIIAVLMVLVSFTLGMIYFGRASRAGIEAIGRNPLAKRVIQLAVLINIVLTIVIVLVGIGIAYLILIL